MDIEKLLKALDKDENEDIIDMTSEKIDENNISVIAELELDPEEEEKIISKLEGYKYIDDVSSLNSGAFIRWICVSNPAKISLSKGAWICDIRFTDEGIAVVCKGIYHRHFQLKFDECLIFQRLNDQERVLLSALDYLAK